MPLGENAARTGADITASQSPERILVLARQNLARQKVQEQGKGRCMKIMIIGAGIGGLTTALALHKAGHQVEVF